MAQQDSNLFSLLSHGLSPPGEILHGQFWQLDSKPVPIIRIRFKPEQIITLHVLKLLEGVIYIVAWLIRFRSWRPLYF